MENLPFSLKQMILQVLQMSLNNEQASAKTFRNDPTPCCFHAALPASHGRPPQLCLSIRHTKSIANS